MVQRVSSLSLCGLFGLCTVCLCVWPGQRQNITPQPTPLAKNGWCVGLHSSLRLQQKGTSYSLSSLDATAKANYNVGLLESFNSTIGIKFPQHERFLPQQLSTPLKKLCSSPSPAFTVHFGWHPFSHHDHIYVLISAMQTHMTQESFLNRPTLRDLG